MRSLARSACLTAQFASIMPVAGKRGKAAFSVAVQPFSRLVCSEIGTLTENRRM